MIRFEKNKLGFLLGLVLLILALALHVLYALRLSTLHFNINRFNKHFFAAIRASGNDEYMRAETHCIDAFKEAKKKSPANEYMVYALHQLGITYRLLKRYGDAEVAFQAEITVAEKVYGPDSQELLSSLTDLVMTYLLHEKTREARETNQRALGIVERGVDEKHATRAKLVRALAATLELELEARQLFEELQKNLKQD